MIYVRSATDRSCTTEAACLNNILMVALNTATDIYVRPLLMEYTTENHPGGAMLCHVEMWGIMLRSPLAYKKVSQFCQPDYNSLTKQKAQCWIIHNIEVFWLNVTLLKRLKVKRYISHKQVISELRGVTCRQ